MPLLYISLLCGGKQISLLYFATIRLVFIHLILTFVGFFNSEFLKLSRNLNLAFLTAACLVQNALSCLDSFSVLTRFMPWGPRATSAEK